MWDIWHTWERRLLWVLRVSRAGRVVRARRRGGGRPGPRELLSSFWSRRSVGGAAPVIRQPVAQGFRRRQPPALGASARGESGGSPGSSFGRCSVSTASLPRPLILTELWMTRGHGIQVYCFPLLLLIPCSLYFLPWYFSK